MTIDPWVLALAELFTIKSKGDITTAELEQTLARFGKELQEFSRKEAYLSAIKCLDECRRFVDRTIAGGRSVRDQRRDCIVELERRARTRSERRDGAEIFHLFVQKIALPQWASPLDEAKYARAAEMILDWNDYFVSYTRRGGAAFNLEFNKLLKAHFARRFDQAELSTHNLVALMTHEQLGKEELRGFFDSSDLRDGDAIGAEIRRQLERTFVFVQLIQRESMNLPEEGKTNWPFDEFTHFRAVSGPLQPKRGTRMTFLIAGKDVDDVSPKDLDHGYKAQWIGFISEENIRWTSVADVRPRADALRRWFRERARAIVERREEMIDAAIDA
jgi:hypothetical protein